MAPARLSVPHGSLSLDRAPAIRFRPDQQPAVRRAVVAAVLQRPAGTVAVAVAARRRPLVVAVSAAAKMDAAAVAASGEERGKTFMEEMRAVAMQLHTRDQSRHGEKKVPLEPPVATWEPTFEGFLLFLADNKLVFETLEAVVGRAAIPWYAEFRNTGLERTEALEKDMEWFKQQGHTIPEPSAAGIGYASFLEELSEEPQAFLTHFYNLYFGHSAGGVLIGKKISEMLDLQKELEFYRWEGNVSQLQKNVRDKFNKVASAWSREEKDRCLDEMENSFVCSVDLRRHLFAGTKIDVI